MNEKKYKVAIIGTGRIGFTLGFDKKREQPASHSFAINKNSRLELLLLGVKAPFIICHGSSKAYAITNAIGVAVKFTENNLVSAITEKIAESQKRNEETDK